MIHSSSGAYSKLQVDF